MERLSIKTFVILFAFKEREKTEGIQFQSSIHKYQIARF